MNSAAEFWLPGWVKPFYILRNGNCENFPSLGIHELACGAASASRMSCTPGSLSITPTLYQFCQQTEAREGIITPPRRSGLEGIYDGLLLLILL